MLPHRYCGKHRRSILLSPRIRVHLSRVGRECGWAQGHMPARAALSTSKLGNSAPESLPTAVRLPASHAARLAQTGAGEGIRTPDPLITNQMLYRLSYASRRKLIIILIGMQIARETQKIFPDHAKALVAPLDPQATSRLRVPESCQKSPLASLPLPCWP